MNNQNKQRLLCCPKFSEVHEFMMFLTQKNKKHGS